MANSHELVKRENPDSSRHLANSHELVKVSLVLFFRYLVIIDDIWHWEEWEVIRKALPKNNLRCKLIMTTRVRSIARKCQTEQGAGVYEPEFGSGEAERLSAMRLSKSVEGTNAMVLSTKIAVMCGWLPFYFCPLAVVCLSSAWAESHHVQGDVGKFNTWARQILDDGFLITPSLKPLVQSLCLGFDDLPLQLRTCMLYCTIYPPEYGRIYRGCLVRKWVAEGFVSQVEIAEAYFDKLVSRNLLQRKGVVYGVHPVMGAFLVCKAKEDNFIAYDWAGNSSHAKQIRRLSLSFQTDRCPDEDVLSHTRSLVVSGYQSQLDGVPFQTFKKLRVLQIHGSSSPENGHLVDICGLIWLKSLVLMDCRDITELPREIGRLQNLETLHVKGTRISKLPTEIEKLQHLETLDVSETEVTELPMWIEKLQSLKTLYVSDTEVMELPREIKNLERLETLDVSGTKVTELPTWIEKLQSLKTLDVSSTEVTELPREIKNLERLETLDVSGTKVTELPTWIEKLQSLKTLDVSSTEVTELPSEIKNLECLETLDVSWTRVRELPKEIRKLQHLRTLDISRTRVRELPKEIWKLQHLRTLDIRGTKVRELPWEVQNSINVLVGDLHSVKMVKLAEAVSPDWVISSSGANCQVRELSCSRDPNPLLSVVDVSSAVRELMSPLGVISSSGGEEIIISSSEAKCRDVLSILILLNHFGDRCEVLSVRMLRVAGRHMKIPQWVKQDLCNVCSLDIRLCKLVHEDLEFLKMQMPNLQALQLRFEVLPREPVAITGGGFPKLEKFYVDCRLPRVITFKREAMPKLKHLEFKFYTGTASRDYYMGIKHLDSLEKVVFRCSKYYTSDGPGIRETIDVLSKEAVEHPNEINLWVNDMLAFGTGEKWISLADKAIVEKRDKLLRAALKRV